MKPDPDNDRVYTRPRAWRNMKEAFANGDPVRRALVRLEKCGRGCPASY